MSEFHLEALRDRELLGQASEAELQALRDHREECSVCALEAELGPPPANEPHDDTDEALFDRVFARLEGELPRAEARFQTSTTGRSNQRRRRAAVIGAVTLASSLAAAAAVPSVRHTVVQLFAPTAPDSSSSSTPAPASGLPVSEGPEVSASSAPTTTASAPVPRQDEAAAPETTTEAAPARSSPALDAATLLKRANAARRQGDTALAARLYRQLQRDHPGSSRSAVSRISLGGLLLGPLGNPHGALAQYDAYLAEQPGGALTEQALVGRAQSLKALGRTAEERSTWRQLLRAYPRSLHAREARKRLGPERQ